MSSFIPNSFQLPNALVDTGAMAEMKGASLAIYIVIVRKTRGWQKEFDAISISQFMKFTGYGKDAVISGAEKLVSLGLVQRISRDHRPTSYSLTDFGQREIDSLSENQTSANLSEKPTGVVGKTDKNLSEKPTHNNNIKTTNKNNTHTNSIDEILNLWMPDLHMLNSWLQRSGEKPMTQEQVDAILLDVNTHYESQILNGRATNNKMYSNFVKWVKGDYAKQSKKPAAPKKQTHKFGQGVPTQMRDVK